MTQEALRAALAALIATTALAAVPPAPQLLPRDTLALATVPDWARASDQLRQSPGGRLWADPSLRAFRENFEKKFAEKVLGAVEKDLGIRMADYLGLVRGQLTLAVTTDQWKGGEDEEPGLLVVIDARDQAEQLKARLAEVRKRLEEKKRPVKVEKIRDLEFATVSIELPKDEDADEDDKPEALELTFGQADTALVAGNSRRAIEQVVARITGGSVPTVGEDPSFQASEAAWFRDAYAYGWAHVAPVYSTVTGTMKSVEPGEAPFDPKAALKAVGLDGLKNALFSLKAGPDGTLVQLSLTVPESQRAGLFKIFAGSAKDSGPAAFVPAGAVKFQRLRLDGQRIWSTLEETLRNISPQLFGFVNMAVGMAGKDKDPAFDFRKTFVANLGDDLITYSKGATGKTARELNDPPTLMLVGSPNAEQFAAGMKAAGGFLPGGGGEEIKDRDFNGKKIRGMRVPAMDGGAERRMEFAASGGYVAISSQPGILEEFLRSAEGGGRSLKDDPAIAEAAQKVGGMGTGLFGYENQRETMRAQWEFLRSGGLDQLLEQSGGRNEWRELFDFKALPAFDTVAKYFGMAVYSGAADAQGLHLKFYGPTPK